jgi:hypothetical protein
MDNTAATPPQLPPIDVETLTLGFLRLVLPSTGPYCAVAIKRRGGPLRQTFHSTIDDLLSALREADRSGRDVYFAVASFRSKESRKAENVEALKCLRLEVDYGNEGHTAPGYGTESEATAALKTFCSAVGLPQPLAVMSGGGLHVYWPLQEALAPDEWRKRAEGLKAACLQHGLKAGHECTADAARILRAPYTTNRKLLGKPRPVQLNQRFLAIEPYDLARFDALLNYKALAGGRVSPTENVVSFRGPKPEYLRNRPANSALMNALLAGLEPPPADAETIADQCAQLGAMRATRGVMPEPTWYACIGVLAFCEGGETLAHEWSKGDERYSPVETRRKFDAWRKLTGPTRCAHFYELDGETLVRCKACPHRGEITSPIQLGSVNEAPPAERAKEERAPTNKSIVQQINKKHFLIRNIGGRCMVGEMVANPAGAGQMLSLQNPEAFKAWYANQFVSVQDQQGNEKRRPLGAYWLVHSDRRGYEGVDLVPNAPVEMPGRMLNLWRGFGVEPRAGDWRLMRRHVCDVLAAGDQKAAEYMLRWVAWSFQHPGEPAEVALVLQGGKGSGKGVFIRAVAKCFGEHGLQITNQEHLIGRFNSHLRSCLLLFADEAFWAGNKKGESVLKGLITEPVLMIEQKGIDSIQWPNRLHVMMAANADWVVPASAGERRYAVFKCANTYVRDRGDGCAREGYFKALHHELENGGRGAMLHDLLCLNLGDWHPRQIYETEGLREQKQHSLAPLEEWFAEVLEDGKLPVGIGGRADRKDFSSTRALVDDAKSRVPRASLWLSDKAMALFLKRQGCLPAKGRRDALQLRGWTFPRLVELRRDWSKRFGGWDWSDAEQEDWQ